MTAGERREMPRARLTREQLIRFHSDLTARARELMAKKNRDYGSESDTFRNFREFGRMGILVRLGDKLSRLRTFVERGTLAVEDESAQDTVQDAINYLILLLAMDEEAK